MSEIISRTLFVADIHLCQEKPKITNIFLNFLKTEAQQCEALYLLGDLFNVWIGDDHYNTLHQKIANALKELSIPKFFTHGNHDFLIGQKFAHSCNMTLLPKEKILILYGKRVLIMHGDTLCIDDKNYQKFREKVHQPWLQNIFLILPINVRKNIAFRILKNREYNKKHDICIIDINQQHVEKIMKLKKVNILIHGHTHNPIIHHFNIQGEKVWRAVPGSWDNKGSIIQLDSNGDISFINFSL